MTMDGFLVHDTGAGKASKPTEENIRGKLQRKVSQFFSYRGILWSRHIFVCSFSRPPRSTMNRMPSKLQADVTYIEQLARDDFLALPSKAQQSLIKLARELEGVVPVATGVWTFNTAELAHAAVPLLVGQVQAWAQGSQQCIYYFECQTTSLDLERIHSVFSRAKDDNVGGRAYARLNHPNACLYVGSSRAIKKRLSEHLGLGAASTYALQLSHWAAPLKLDLRFVCARYDEHIDYASIQMLEDALWHRKQPMFGRQGRK